MSNFYIDGQPKEVTFCNKCVYSNQKVVPSALTAAQVLLIDIGTIFIQTKSKFLVLISCF